MGQPKLKDSKSRFSIVMKKDLHERLKEFSEERGVTISSAVSFAVHSFMDSMDASKRLMEDEDFVRQLIQQTYKKED